MIYEEALEIEEPERALFLAIPEHIYSNEIEDEMLIQKVLEHKHLHVIFHAIQDMATVVPVSKDTNIMHRKICP